MDVKSLLNEDKEDTRNDDNNDATPPKRPPPPPLTTSRSGSYYAASPHSNTFDSPHRYSHPLIPQSPGSFAPPSAHSYTSTPFSAAALQHQSPYQRNVPLPSPGPRSGSLSNYFPPGQRPSSHHSINRSSTSPLEPISSFNGSPQLSRNAQTPSAPYPQHQLHPHTPLGPPPPIVRQDSSNPYDSPAPPYQRHRSSSGASYVSPRGVPRPLPPVPRSGPSPNQEPQLRRESFQSYTSHRGREESVSVSPRTVAPIIRRQSSQAEPEPLRPRATMAAVHHVAENGLTAATPLNDTQRNSSAFVQRAPEGYPSSGHGIKRPAEMERESSVSSRKKAKVSRPPPIWVRPKCGLPLFKLRPELKVNGITGRQSKSPQPPVSQQPSQAELSQCRPEVSYNSILDDSFERTFRGVIPGEDLIFQVADFIFTNVVQADPSTPLEIEAKVGCLIDRRTQARLHGWARSETTISPEEAGKCTFQSQMTEDQHKTMNNFLNDSVVLSNKPANGKPRLPMQYHHHREADAFYELPQSEFDKLEPQVKHFLQTNVQQRGGTHRVRVTRDLQTSEITAKVIKARIADLNIHCPQWSFDWRVSISVEFPWDGQPETLEEHAVKVTQTRREPRRNKDRLSYSHQFCRIDLTQVKVGVKPGGNFDQISHELEVEMDVPTVRAQGQLVQKGQPNHYSEFVKVFVDNVRTLAKAIPKS